MSNKVQRQKTKAVTSPTSYFLLLTVLLLAAGLRLYQLPTLPPGLNFDEAGNGVAALEILHGAPRLWWIIGGGKEPLWPYIMALSTATLGNMPFSLRWPAALAGVLTVAAVYPLLLVLFKGIVPRRQARLLAFLTMLGLAFSEWHLHFSRLGFRAILLPLFSTLAFYFLWKTHASLLRAKPPCGAPHSSRLTPHSLCFTFYVLRLTFYPSLFTALAIYSYLAGRLLPAAPLLYFMMHWLLTTFKRYRKIRPTTNDQRQTTKTASKFTATSFFTRSPLPATHSTLPTTGYLLLTALFLLPLIIHFLLNPADFTARAGAVSIFNPAWHHGDLIGTFRQTLTTTLGAFLGLTGDANPLVNLPHQPAVPLYLAPFFVAGLVASIYRTFFTVSPQSPLLPGRFTVSHLPTSQPPNLPASQPPTPFPHLFLLCWWLVMLLPAILAPEGAPHHLRLIGTLVPTYAFIALGFTLTVNLLQKLIPYAPLLPSHTSGRSLPMELATHYSSLVTHHASPLPYLLPAACYLLLFTQTTTNYFYRWPASTDFTLPFDLYAINLAGDIARAPATTGYVLPMDIRAAQEARHYTLDYLLAGRPANYKYIPVDERNAETGLTQAAAGKHELRLVSWTEDKHHEADAKEIVTFLLETTAILTERQSFRGYDIKTYTLPKSPNFHLPLIDQPVGLTFADLLRLDAAYVPPSARAGDWLPVALTLAPIAPMDTDYKASIRLIGPNGERLAQKDRTLRHNFHQGTSLWPPETVNEYYLLPAPPEAPPGEYTVVVVLYHPETQAPLVAGGVVEAPVGRVQITASDG